MSYPFETILINNRKVRLKEICSGKLQPHSDFEASTFDFICLWLTGANKFSAQTSGSTGNPKTISLSRQQMQQSAQRTIQALGLNEGDNALVCLNTAYIAGKMMLVRAFEANMKIVAIDPSSDPFENLTPEVHVDFMAVVPHQLQNLLSGKIHFERLNKIKSIIVGGAAVSEKLKSEIQAIPCQVYATYGMTETISHVALQLLNTNLREDYFRVLPGITLTTDERGCLVIDDPILNGPMETNDIAELLGNGKFTWIGRVDNVINTGGIKVHPEKLELEIERTTLQFQLDINFFVGALPHNSLGQQVTLIVEGTPLDSDIEKQILTQLSQKVSPYEVPKTIRYLPTFPVTSNGKINRVAALNQLAKS